MSSNSYDVQTVNQRLLDLYGRHIEANRANFRVTWSDDQYEKRFGTFSLYSGDIFIREETGIKEAMKYPWLDNQYVVERLHPNYHKDVMEGDYTYEPLWVFPTGLPLKWEAIELVVAHALKKVPSDTPRTEKEAMYQDAEKRKKEVKEARHALDEISNPSNIQLNLQDGDAVSLAVKKFADMKTEDTNVN